MAAAPSPAKIRPSRSIGSVRGAVGCQERRSGRTRQAGASNLSYAIGVARPVSVTSRHSARKTVPVGTDRARHRADVRSASGGDHQGARPAAPIFEQTAAYGHLGGPTWMCRGSGTAMSSTQGAIERLRSRVSSRRWPPADVCPDRPGIVSASRLLFDMAPTSSNSDQHSTERVRAFSFMRIEFRSRTCQ